MSHLTPRSKYWITAGGGGILLGLTFIIAGSQQPSWLMSPTTGVLYGFAIVGLYYYFTLRALIDALAGAKGHPADLFLLVATMNLLLVSSVAWIPWLWNVIPGIPPTYDGYQKSFYFTAVTFTTLGYGDIVPGENVVGRQFASYTALFGVSHAMAFFGALTLKKFGGSEKPETIP